MDEQPPVEPPPPSPLTPRSILSPAEILVQLAIVVVGILIALSFEGALQWSRDRALLREARQNIQNEIRNNQKDIQIVLSGIAPVRTKFFRAMELLNDLSAPEKHKEAVTIFDPNNSGALANGLTLAWLNTASYTTAQVSGAMGLMDYRDVRQLAEIYDPQQLFISAQDGVRREVKAATMLGLSIVSNPSPEEVADVKRQVRIALGTILEMEVFAKVLNERYERALKERSD